MSQSRNLTLRAAALTGLGALCRTYKIDAARLLREAGLPSNAESEPDRRLSVSAANQVFELAAMASGQEDFGLRLAELRGLSNLGPIGLIARDEPTVGEAFAVIEAYLPLHNDALSITRQRFGEIIVLRSEILEAGNRTQAISMALAVQVRILRQLAGPSWSPEEVCLSRPQPADLSRFRQILGPRLRFNAEFDGIVIRADLFARPNPMAEAAFRPYASQLLGNLAPGAGETMTARVGRVLALTLPSGRSTAAHVAMHLGTSRRTLTRALEAEGTRFLELLDQAREAVAQRHLAGQARSLTQIADLLGFSSPAAFTTWFRRRFAVTPSEWRSQSAQPKQHGKSFKPGR